MEPPLIPVNDAARIEELLSYGVLDTEADPCLDDISELARRVAQAEIGIISLVDANRQWFKSCVGAPLGQQETPRDVSFCGHTILQRDPLIINDACADYRFADNPLVTGGPRIRFYAGFPLVNAKGFALGSLCVISCSPHHLDAQQIDGLQRLARLAIQHLHTLRLSAALGRTRTELHVDRVSDSARGRLANLERFISREQMVQMIELMFDLQLGSSFALLRCRFRDYERVNATLGGAVSEEFMAEAARRLLAAAPRSASVARFADAELVMLLPHEEEAANVQKVAERVIAFASQVYRSGVQTLSMAVSIGIAICGQKASDSDDIGAAADGAENGANRSYDNVDSILADTSMAVRMARRSNGSAFRFIDGESRVAAREVYRLESAFREAMASKLLEPYLQPIVDLSTGAPLGFESLARWSHDGTLLPPASFLGLSAESGLTGELDLLIVEKSLAALPLLAQPIPRREMVMSVNLSGILLEDVELRHRLLALIDDNPCPPGWTLQVELVEDSFQDTTAVFDDFLRALVARNVCIAIDDFGTGYSSLARLISLPIQSVKVDRVFVSRIEEEDESPRTLLRTMLTMLGDLGLSVTAEGVEEPRQRDWLLQNGVTRAQGYLYSRPLSISAAIESLQQLHYRPRAIPVDPSRLRSMRRRRLRSFFRLPFLGSPPEDRRQG
jgi:EAL domain-containing protein (putative c-di-GMP-specific phosphodiesterase class I)/GGDEF domain-containing protein